MTHKLTNKAAGLIVLLALTSVHPITAEPSLSNQVLLPFFEVELDQANLTTVFAVANAASVENPIELSLYTNLGVHTLDVELTLDPHAVVNIDLAAWLREGKLPTETLGANELAHLQAAHSGQVSPRDGKLYGEQIVDNRATGYAIARMKNPSLGPSLWGDYFVIAPQQDHAEGENLVALDRSCSSGICTRHALRFLVDAAALTTPEGSFDRDTEIVIWTHERNEAQEHFDAADELPVAARIVAYNNAGEAVGQTTIDLLPVEILSVNRLAAELGLVDALGWLDITTTTESFITVRYSSTTFSVALNTYCMPEEEPGITIEKSTNGYDADAAPGPQLVPGTELIWEYLVKNDGELTLSDILVVDDQGVDVSCPSDSLEPGEWMVCEGRGLVEEVCSYRNIGTVTALTPMGVQVMDSDASHYHTGGNASIDIEKLTNGEDADTAPGPVLVPGDAVEWTYEVTNTGETTLYDIEVTDDQGVSVSCPQTTLESGESMTCTGNGITTVGQYQNVGTVKARSGCSVVVSDQDASHYFGEEPPADEPPLDEPPVDEPPVDEPPTCEELNPTRWSILNETLGANDPESEGEYRIRPTFDYEVTSFSGELQLWWTNGPETRMKESIPLTTACGEGAVTGHFSRVSPNPVHHPANGAVWDVRVVVDGAVVDSIPLH